MAAADEVSEGRHKNLPDEVRKVFALEDGVHVIHAARQIAERGVGGGIGHS